MHELLKEKVLEANLALVKHGLVIFTWGNSSQRDPETGHIVIKPSGVPYDGMTADQMVVLDADGKQIEGDLRPSSDAPTHVTLYRHFRDMGGVVHTHSEWATSWAQAGRPLPPYGTTHADYFFGDIPVTREMSRTETSKDYEKNTGLVIVETFRRLNSEEIPAVLVANHGPFVWGRNPQDAVHHAIIVEFLAKMEIHTKGLNPEAPRPPQCLVDTHYRRKHGAGAYYGQQKNGF